MYFQEVKCILIYQGARAWFSRFLHLEKAAAFDRGVFKELDRNSYLCWTPAASGIEGRFWYGTSGIWK